MKTLKNLLTAAFVLFGTVANAQYVAKYSSFDDWDGDHSGLVEVEEWNEAYHSTGVFSDWDANDDEFLDNQDFLETNWQLWDETDDDRLNAMEWSTSMREWYGESDYGSFTDWDENGDGFVDAKEYESTFANTNLWKGWDTDSDGVLNEDEFGSYIYSVYDNDGDGILSNDEWELFNNERDLL